MGSSSSETTRRDIRNVCGRRGGGGSVEVFDELLDEARRLGSECRIVAQLALRAGVFYGSCQLALVVEGDELPSYY
jgi:hypothetical protein